MGPQVAEGGEGRVYATDRPESVVKIYSDDKLTVGRRRKLELMVTRPAPGPRIAWPNAVVRDGGGCFRGFLMPRATGKPLRHGLFIPRVWLRERPDWDRRDSVRLATVVLEQIRALHRTGVLLGDINPQNILVEDAGTVWQVDCDSYQVGDYPCPVGTANFTPPELQGVDYPSTLRTLDQEHFAVATLLFMILMPGKTPYSHEGGGDGAANVLRGHFPYALGEKGSDRAPKGYWRFCWSHLPRDMKDAFHRTFEKGEGTGARTTTEEWLRMCGRYRLLLADDAKVFRGPKPAYGFDLSILPHNRRHVRDKGSGPRRDGKTDLEVVLERFVQPSRPAAGTQPAAGFASTGGAVQVHRPAPRPAATPPPAMAPRPSGGFLDKFRRWFNS